MRWTGVGSLVAIVIGVSHVHGHGMGPSPARRYELVTLPARADDEVRARTRTGAELFWRLDQATNAVGELRGNETLFRKGARIADRFYDVAYRPIDGGVEDFVSFAARPARERISYSLDTRSFAGIRALGDVVELLDEHGTPQFRMRAPYVVDARGIRRDVRVRIRRCQYDASPVPPWDRVVIPPGAPSCSVELVWGREIGESLAYPAVLDPAWVDSATMVHPRNFHSAVRLANGRVLVAGGYLDAVSSTYTNEAEVFDPATGTWAAAQAMTHARARVEGVLFPTGPLAGKVLMAAGDDQQNPTAELFDPATGTWTETAPMKTVRDSSETVLLDDGRVLVAGGCSAYTTTCDVLESSAELFDPTSGTWTLTGGMTVPRSLFSLDKLADGRVLAAGGCTAYFINFSCTQSTDGTDIFDPSTGAWIPTGDLVQPQQEHASVRLADGRVLITGGSANGLTPVETTQLFDPTSGIWTLGPNLPGGFGSGTIGAELSLLPSGALLATGSVITSTASASDGCFTFEPVSTAWSPALSMLFARGTHTATTLADGRVLISGGLTTYPSGGNLDVSGVSEIYDEAATPQCTAPTFLESSCAECAKSKCCHQLQTCMANPGCADRLDCFEICGSQTMSTPAFECLAICAASPACPNDLPAYELFQQVAWCIAAKDCAADCQNDTATSSALSFCEETDGGTGGTTGTGGAHDGGSSEDGGGIDGGSGASGGSGGQGSAAQNSDGGCGCRTAPMRERSGAPWVWAVAAFGTALIARRASRRRIVGVQRSRAPPQPRSY